MSFLAAAKLLAPTVGREVLEGGVRYGASRVIGRAASRGLASVAGQRLAGRVAGERVASVLASKPGQKYVGKYIAHETRQTLKGDEAESAKPAPMPTTPVSEDVNPNLMSPDTPVGRRQRQQGWQDNGTMGSKFGNGAGWWNAAAITDPMGAGYDWRSLSDTSVARGPAEYNMAGKGMGRRTVGRAVGFVQGYRGAKPEQIEPYKHGPEEIAQINENIASTWPTTPNAPTNPSQNITQISRSEAFNFGSDSDLGYGSRNPVGSFSTYPRPPRTKPYTGGTSFS